MKVLFLSMYYKPLNTIAAYRAVGLVNALNKAGIDCHVITRYYDENQVKGKNMHLGGQESQNFAYDYIREGNVVYTGFKTTSRAKSVSEKLPRGIRGLYNLFKIDVFHYSWYEYAMKAYKAELAHNKYDCIIASYGPPVVLLAASELSKTYNIPWIADFRDIYIDERDKGLVLSIKRRIQKKLLKQVSLIVFASEGMRNFFLKNAGTDLKNKKMILVQNGITASSSETYSANDHETVKEFSRIRQNYKVTLLHTGTVYEGQNIDFFMRAIREFNAVQNDVALIFLGINTDHSLDTDGNFFFLPKTSMETSIFLQQQADALILPVWEGRYTGFSGKTAEYLWSNNVVFVSPNPQNDLRTYMAEAKNVFIFRNLTELKDAISALIRGEIVRKPAADRKKYTREYWADIFANEVLKFKKKK